MHGCLSTPQLHYVYKRQEPPLLYNDTAYIPVVDFDNNPMHVGHDRMSLSKHCF